MFVRVLVTLLVALAAGCGGGDSTLSLDEYHELVEDARVCEVGDVCVLATPPRCTCAFPVRADAVEQLNALGEQVDCEGEGIPFCPSFANPRCEDGICTGDM